jgi:DDE family transposase/transposase-like protein DUF772
MGTIANPSLFNWQSVANTPELERLAKVLDCLPDKDLISTLNKERNGINDKYQIEPMWNSIIAGIVYGHTKISTLIRELQRNPSLCQICGFDLVLGDDAIPKDFTYSRFFVKLFKHENLVNNMFDTLLDTLSSILPGFGVELGIDGKKIKAYGRKDEDADWAKQVYKGVKKDGSAYQKVVSWFGYRIHLIIDVNYEIPIEYKVTKASDCEVSKLIPMIENINKKHPEIIERAETIAGDKGYDCGNTKRILYEEYGIIPLIDIRDCHTNTAAGAFRPLDYDRRRVLPKYRHSPGFVNGYKKRTAVERVNSRIDHVYELSKHCLRGIKKVKLRIDLSMIVMLATAVAWVKKGRIDKVRSLLSTA